MTILAISLPTILARVRSARELEIIVGIAAVIIAVMTLWEKWKKYHTRNWPTTIGTMSNLQVRKVSGGLNGVDYWKVTIDFTYQVQQAHQGSYSFNCASEEMSQGAIAGLTGKTVCVHYSPSKEGKALLWEDEIWDLWWDTYWNSNKNEAKPASG